MVAEVEGTKTRLLVEARDLYIEAGVAHFSLREVARRVGVSAAAVYRHFASKEALLDEVWVYSRHAADAVQAACAVPVHVFAPPVSVRVNLAM